LVQAGLINKLSERFGQHLEPRSTLRGSQIIDATIVSTPSYRPKQGGWNER